MLDSKSGTNDHPISPFDTRFCVSEFWTSQPCFYRVKTPNYGLQTQLKSKSGMNRHPIRPFDTIICVSEFWASQLSFLTFKPCKYTHQRWVMSKSVSRKKKSHYVVKPGQR